MAYLSDDQIHRLAVQLDELRVGGVHGAIVFIAVVAIAALLVLALIPWH